MALEVIDENVCIVPIPIGYRFAPTDEELITYYLWNKVLRIPLPAEVIQDIDATEIYSMPPDALGKLVVA